MRIDCVALAACLASPAQVLPCRRFLEDLEATNRSMLVRSCTGSAHNALDAHPGPAKLARSDRVLAGSRGAHHGLVGRPLDIVPQQAASTDSTTMATFRTQKAAPGIQRLVASSSRPEAQQRMTASLRTAAAREGACSPTHRGYQLPTDANHTPHHPAYHLTPPHDTTRPAAHEDRQAGRRSGGRAAMR
eukprot:COSAG01_NODE_26724_length_705_cov_0.780528_1_plen_189_part_00